MELNATPFTLTLFAQAVFLAISRLDFVSLDVQRIITVVLIVVNAALVMLFKTDSGKQALNKRLIDQSDSASKS